MDFGRISRRHLLQGGAALTLGSAFGARSALAADTTIGFIYVGSRDDYGYNQAHAQGAAALKKMSGLKVVEEEKVPETDAVEKTIESMINLDGASLLFPTSFGYYNPHMIKMASKFPKLRFEHCGGLWSDKDPKNAGSYSGYIAEAQYISDSVAGYTSKTGKLGFVAAKPIPQVLRNINAFTLGARLANPKATTQVIFTGDWSMPVKEAEATNSLIDQGAAVLTCHVDGPQTRVDNPARRRARSRPEGSRAGEDGLSGRGRARSDFVPTEAADPVKAVGIAPAADAGFLQRYGTTIEYILIPGAALVGALAVFGIFVALFGKNPLDLYFFMYQGAVGTWYSWQNTLTRAAPLILTALCTALPAQLGMVIIGGEGALLIGALSATGAALALPSMPPLVVQLAMVCAGMVGGGLWDKLSRGVGGK